MRLYIAAALLASLSLLAQQQHTIRDKNTNELIPYVNVFFEGEGAGTSADQYGSFTVPQDEVGKTLLLSAVGYESLQFKSGNSDTTIYLSPSITELEEIVITQSKKDQRLSIGKFKKRDFTGGFACGTTPWMIGRFFAYDTAYTDTPFLESVTIHTNSKVKNVIMNLRLYLPGADGMPDKFLHEENIIFNPKKGANFTEINISNLNIQFPEQGFFVVVEWLIVDSNRHEYEYTIAGSNVVHKDGISYEPTVSAISDSTGNDSWQYVRGLCARHTGRAFDGNKPGKDIILLAAEIKLTN